MALLIFYQVTFVSNYHEGGAERPLANLSAVNYGNLPSCLSASAAGLPFVSKSKAPICNIGTFSFLQGQGAHKRLTTGDIYSRRSLRPPLQNAAHSSTWAKPTTWLRSTKPKPVRSGTGTSLCLSSGPVCAGVQRAWVTKGGEDKKYKNTQTQHLCWGGLIQNYGIFGWVLSLSGTRRQRKGEKLTSWYYFMNICIILFIAFMQMWPHLQFCSHKQLLYERILVALPLVHSRSLWNLFETIVFCSKHLILTPWYFWTSLKICLNVSRVVCVTTLLSLILTQKTWQWYTNSSL